MAKCRFPGKALKLNSKKRVKFRQTTSNENYENEYSRKIAQGFEAFRNFFGESEVSKFLYY